MAVKPEGRQKSRNKGNSKTDPCEKHSQISEAIDLKIKKKHQIKNRIKCNLAFLTELNIELPCDPKY